MCGIVAIQSQTAEIDVERLEAAGRALDRLAHRGPDDRGMRAVGRHAWLGHRRLSIVDLEGGHQPLGGAGEEDWSLVCNGEIYNHLQLREQLPEAAFGSSSDSAAALALLRTEGPRGLHRLRGMFALCAATPAGGFVAARDAVGIKPLYWARTEAGTYFASELRAFDPELQPAAEIFPPGCWWTSEEGLRRFASAVPEYESMGGAAQGGPVPVSPVRSRPESGRSALGSPAPERREQGASGREQGGPESSGSGLGSPGRDGTETSREALERATFDVVADSVRRHLMADVEVGVFLSGGLDSGLVAAVAAEEYARRGRRLKTFAVGAAGSPDLIAARETAAFLGTEHHEAILDAEEARAALKDVVGCVESFDASLIRSAVPNWFLARLASRHVKVVLTGEGADELFAGYGYYHERHGAPSDLDAELRRTLEALHGLNLQRCDRITMAHGLEARVPFLDHDVIAHAMSLPADLKTLERDGMEKGHLRRAFAGRLPEHLLWRRKEQFGTGSGAQDLLGSLWDEDVTDRELAEATAGEGAPPLRSKEELGYYRIFRAALPGVRPEAVLTRFATA